MDLSALTALLAGLGPWGIAAGVGLTLVFQWLKRRQQPTPGPTPAPGPAPDPLGPLLPVPNDPGKRPLLDLLAKLLPILLARKHAAATSPAVAAAATGTDPVEDELLKLIAGVIAKEPPAK